MLAANAKLNSGPSRAAALGSNLDQFADAIDIKRHEGVGLEHSTLRIFLQQTRSVVAR